MPDPAFFTYPGCDDEETDYILLHHNKPLWLHLNHTAIEIARHLLEGKAIEDISHELSSAYGISCGLARQDVSYVSELLEKHHFLMSSSRTQAPAWEQEKVERLPTLQSLLVHLTTRCNLHCPHCYVEPSTSFQSSSLGTKKKDLPISLIYRLIDQLTENAARTIVLTGGEPLLYPEIKAVIQYSVSRGLAAQILTNGTLIDKAWADFLSDKDVLIQLSIDGATPKTHDAIRGKGTFDKICQTVKYLQEAGLASRLSFCTTIMRQNIPELPDIILLAKKLGIPKLRFLPLRKTGGAAKKWDGISGMDTNAYENFFKYISIMIKDTGCNIDITCGLSGFMLSIPREISDDDIWCPVGKQLVVNTDGNAYSCVLMMNDEFRLGNVFTDSLSHMIFSEKMNMICDALANRRNRIPKCAACLWRNFCQSGCMGQALDHKSTIWDTDDFCEYRKQAYKEAFDRILGIGN